MKKILIYFNLFAILIFMLSACEDVLDQKPQDRYSDVLVWSDVEMAEAYLRDVYRTIWSPVQNPRWQAGVTDECHSLHSRQSRSFYTGALSAGDAGAWTVSGGFGDWNANYFKHASWRLFSAVQKANVFIANADNLIESGAPASRVNRMKGEAIFLRAWSYTQMIRAYGGLPIMNEPFVVGDDYLGIERASFEETVNFIVADLDEAAGLLGTKTQMTMGKAPKGAALALKSRLLLFAASDLTADGNAGSKYVGYESPNRQALWTAAKNAALAVMNLGTYSLADFGAPDQEAVADNYFEFFKQYDLSHPEIIWGKMFDEAQGDRIRTNRSNGPNGLNGWGGNTPTQNLVDAYRMADGTDFWEHFEVDDNNLYQNISSTYSHESPYYNREPRFYATILYDSAVWMPRYPNLEERDPVGIYDRRTRLVIQGGNVVSELPGIDTRSGPVEDWNGAYTGYTLKKYQDNTIHTRDDFNTNVWIHIRYAEILLNYAEACLGLGEITEATTYLNMIRNRAGLPDFNGDIKEILQRERQIELAFEDHRFYDMRRWKIMEEVLTDVKGMDIMQITEDGEINTTWRQIHVETRVATPRNYWIPIEQVEIDRAPQLVQNPEY